MQFWQKSIDFDSGKARRGSNRSKYYAVAAYGALIFASAVAQDALAATAAAAPVGLEEVTVVARRVEERLQDVPISITAITPLQLKEKSIDAGADLIKIVPSMFVMQNTNGSNNFYALRGIGNGVVAYFADVPTDTAEIEDQLFDMSSVQALSGPQGTLFGRKATGGAILFVPQKPTNEFEGSI